MNAKDVKPFYNVGPGHFISDFLDSLGWKQADLAEVTGLSTKTINKLINNRQGITPETAVILEKTFSAPADFWIEVDAKYQIREREEQNCEKNEVTAKRAQLRKYMPVLEMKKKNWFLYDVDTIQGIEKECLRVFKQNCIPEDVYSADYAFCARQTKFDYDYTLWYSKTWYAYSKLHADSFKLPQYDREGLQKIADTLHEYTTKADGVLAVIDKLNSCGVGFFSLSHLQKTYLDGAAFIHNTNPFIVYTCRYDRIDNFWFVLAHEIAHILHHYDFLTQPILDNLEVQAGTDREKEADAFAGCYLNQNIVLEVGARFGKYLNASRLSQISEQTKVSVPVALGMLQHAGILDWRQFSKYKMRVKELIPETLIKG